MENFILLFIMVAIIVINTSIQFKNVFEDMWLTLGIIYWPLSNGNHKGMIVKKYHCFLNKTQEIAGQDRGTHGVFLHNAKTSQYAWNSVPINGTYILRSVPAVSCEFCFLVDVEILQTPTNLNQGNYGMYEYL